MASLARSSEVRAISPVKGAGMLIIGDDEYTIRNKLANSKKSYMSQLNVDTGGLKAFTKKKDPFEGYVDPHATTGLVIGLRPNDEIMRNIKAKEYKDALSRQKDIEQELRTSRLTERKRDVVDPAIPLPYMRY